VTALFSDHVSFFYCIIASLLLNEELIDRLTDRLIHRCSLFSYRKCVSIFWRQFGCEFMGHRLKDTNVIVSCYHAATTTTAARPFMTTGGVCLLFVCSSCPMIGRVTRSRPVLQRTDFAGRSRSTDNRRHLTNISAINSANPATWTRWTSRQEEGRQTG